NLIAKSVETGIALHEGRMFGWANQLLALFAALAVLLLSVSGAVMWWRRRPAGRLGVPQMPASTRAWRGALAIVALMGLMFPLVGVSLVAVLLLDWAVIQRVPALRRALS
ncbi:MAG TPA: PepSY domain-containing protein, partial [Herpetosiphonaceae bacterium]